MSVLPMLVQLESGASRVLGIFSYLWEEWSGILFQTGSGRVPEQLCLIVSAWCLLIREAKY